MLTGYTFSTASLSGAYGTMVDRGAVTSTLSTQGGSYTIPSGYHSGSGKVTASFSNLSAGNIKKGVNIGGVVGNYISPPFKTTTSRMSEVWQHELTSADGQDGYVTLTADTTSANYSFMLCGCQAYDMHSSQTNRITNTGGMPICIYGTSSNDINVILQPGQFWDIKYNSGSTMFIIINVGSTFQISLVKNSASFGAELMLCRFVL